MPEHLVVWPIWGRLGHVTQWSWQCDRAIVTVANPVQYKLWCMNLWVCVFMPSYLSWTPSTLIYHLTWPPLQKFKPFHYEPTLHHSQWTSKNTQKVATGQCLQAVILARLDCACRWGRFRTMPSIPLKLNLLHQSGKVVGLQISRESKQIEKLHFFQRSQNLQRRSAYRTGGSMNQSSWINLDHCLLDWWPRLKFNLPVSIPSHT